VARHRGRQTEWPIQKGDPNACFLAPDGYRKSDRLTVGPLRMGTEPGVGPTGKAVIADYETRTDYGTDMIARDRRIDRKFPSDLIAREKRGPGGSLRNNTISEGKRMPK
jgi:hypothetical protein